MTQDPNRRQSPQGPEQPREYSEQPPYERHGGGSSPGQQQGGSAPEGEYRQPPTERRGGRPGGQQGPPMQGQQGPPMQGQQTRQGPPTDQPGSTAGQFEQYGRMDQPRQRQPPRTEFGQQSMGPPQGRQTGGEFHQRMGDQPQQTAGGQQFGGGQAEQSMGGHQSMGGQPGGPAQMGEQPGARQLPVEPVGAEAVAETDVVTADRDDPLTSIVEMMEHEDVGSVVITEDDRPIGIVTDRKVALSLADRPDVSQMTAADVMTGDLQTVTEDMSVFEVIQTLGDSAIRRAPIVDDDGRLTGIVSVDDMLVLLSAELDQLGEVVERQIERF